MSQSLSNVGLQVVPGVSAGSSSFTEPPKRNIGILMERERGVPNKVFNYTSQEEDVKYLASQMLQLLVGGL